MPNLVTTIITFNDSNMTEEKKQLLRNIENVGFCEYLRPCPEELKEFEGKSLWSSFFHRMVEGGAFTDEEIAEDKIGYETAVKAYYNFRKYGYLTEYEFRRIVWGTKWCVDLQVSESEISFTSAWGPVNMEIIKEFAKHFEFVNYTWFEEQMYGQEFETFDGELQICDDFDSPNVEEVEIGGEWVWFVESEWRSHQPGYYKLFHDLDNTDMFLGHTVEEALESIKNGW